MNGLGGETERGFEYLKEIFESGKTLRVGPPKQLRGDADYFGIPIIGFSKSWELCLTRNNLNDLPGTPEHRDAAMALAATLSLRMRNSDPHLYLTASGTVARIVPRWPYSMLMGEADHGVLVQIEDLQTKQTEKRFVVSRTHYEYSSNPYRRHEDIVNTVRSALDSGKTENVLEATLNATTPSPISADEFVQAKVWMLGHIAGATPQSLVWITDPWDSEYFSISKEEMARRVVVLNAQQKIELLEDGSDFARVGQVMLVQDGPDKVDPPAKADEFHTALDVYTLKGGQLGEGGAGRVVRVEDPDGEPFALKYLKPEALTTQRSKRFRNEIQFCASTNHKNIIRVLDWGISRVDGNDVPFYLMPIYPKTLKSVMSSKASPAVLLDLFQQILEGVQWAHDQNVWHRDLKPENVMVSGNNDIAVVSDFGIAHFAEPLMRTLVQTGRHDRMGSFKYAAPEQRNNSKVTHLADIYSLGIILYEMFTGAILQGTGHKPIGAENSELSYLDPIINMMVQHSPENRPQTISAVRDLLIAGRRK
ncbi:MAG TPA: serine/threonine-protein kinase [Terracidiphilus sp.]|nr:serine/threonine-protein kinase [Terracidiphilus sp.]